MNQTCTNCKILRDELFHLRQILKQTRQERDLYYPVWAAKYAPGASVGERGES